LLFLQMLLDQFGFGDLALFALNHQLIEE
jgi:hypothetical protein